MWGQVLRAGLGLCMAKYVGLPYTETLTTVHRDGLLKICRDSASPKQRVPARMRIMQREGNHAIESCPAPSSKAVMRVKWSVIGSRSRRLLQLASGSTPLHRQSQVHCSCRNSPPPFIWLNVVRAPKKELPASTSKAQKKTVDVFRVDKLLKP